MNVESNPHVQDIRARVARERTVIAELSPKLGDLKQLLKHAEHRLDDVEGFFLGKVLQEPRTPQALAIWLGNAELVLQMAVQQREYVEGLVKKYGADAKLM